MKVAVCGAAGQLGKKIMATVPAHIDAIPLVRSDVDLSDATAVSLVLDHFSPDVVINAAAYTSVDAAEENREAAYLANFEAVGNLATWCAAASVRFLHVSTDFVFDGTTSTPYLPTAATNPLSVYGASKLEGERRIESCDGLDFLILRTSWLYGEGANFVTTMLKLMSSRPEIRVVTDQVGSPTWTRGLAMALWTAVSESSIRGIHHWADLGVASWYDLAHAVRDIGVDMGKVSPDVTLIPIRTAEYPTPARRPAFSVLDTAATRAELGLSGQHWRTQLASALQEIEIV